MSNDYPHLARGNMYINSRYSNNLKFTAHDRQVLQKTIIDENQPGTVVQDFNTALNIFRENRQTLTPAYQLNLQSVKNLNQRLRNPVQQALKRPVQKSYPRVHGLYLLLRASGLTYVEMAGDKPTLVVDEDGYKQWTSLNPTELRPH